MSNRRLSTKSTKSTKSSKLNLFWRSLLAATFTSLLFPNISNTPTLAQLQELNEYCQVSPQAAKAKENLRVSAFKGNKEAQYKYDGLRQQHAQLVQDCRNRNWLQVQAIWLRLYPCDMQPGAIERIMDKIVNRGYNQVYLEAFYDGRVLLPEDTNPTIWPSVVSSPGNENVDLLAQGIQKGRERGLKVYAWMFTTNFGYSYAQHQDRENAIARNGKGQTSLYVVDDGSQVFIDPYNEQAKADYKLMVQEILRRRPDGLLFDYIRYPRQTGKNSIATKVTDLWLYSDATQQALFRRAQNNKGLDFIQRFLNKGYVTTGDIAEVDELYPTEGEPFWQGHNNLYKNSDKNSNKGKSTLPIKLRQRQLQNDLWSLSVAHAMQGVVDFLTSVSYPVENKGISTGAVFFPDANKNLGQGYDSRLQPWDKFPNYMEWHPMSYADCGNTNCIATQVEQVLAQAKPGTQIIPALAGTWGKIISNRPPLEAQMQALQKLAPQIKGVSHFAFSWQFPEQDGDRKFCRK